MRNYLENLPDEIIDYIYLIRYKEDFKKTLNEINYKNILLNGNIDVINEFYNREKRWWKTFYHSQDYKERIKITHCVEKRKGWLTDMVKEKLNITMFKKYKEYFDNYECLATYYNNKYNLLYSSNLATNNFNSNSFYSNILNKRHHIYSKDDLKLMLRNNGYLNGSMQLEDQLSKAALKQYYARVKPNFYNYKNFYNSWTKEKLIKEIMQL